MIVSLVFQFDPIFRRTTIVLFAKCENERIIIWKWRLKKKERRNVLYTIDIIETCLKKKNTDHINSTILKMAISTMIFKKCQMSTWMVRLGSVRFSHKPTTTTTAHFIRFKTFHCARVHSLKCSYLAANWISLSSRIQYHLSFWLAHIFWRFGHLAFNDLSCGSISNSNWYIF